MLDAERGLETQTYDRARVDELLQPLRYLVEQDDLWQDLTESIALFRAPGFFRCCRLPFRVPELVAVADSFYLRPLHPLVEANGRVYLLLLQHTRVKLFWVDRKTISELRLFHASGELNEEQMRAGFGGIVSAAARPSFDANRAEGADSTRSVSAQCARAETIVVDRFCDYAVRIVLAGPDCLCQSYRKFNPSPDLLEEEIHVEHGYGLHELQQQVWAVASSHFIQAQRSAVDQYHQFWHTLRASNELRVIVSAARRGRVEVLFLTEDLLQANRVDSISGKVVVPSRSSTCEEDLLNLAAIDTFLGGGAVYSMPVGQVPGRGSAAAVFAY